MGNPQAGWYPDPSGDVTKLRYWDGMQWTNNYTDAIVQPAITHNPPYTQSPMVYGANQTDSTLRLIAFILNVVSALAGAALIFPLLWMIPICVRSWNIYKGTRPNTIGFGVVDLIFVNLVSGILLLISTKEA